MVVTHSLHLLRHRQLLRRCLEWRCIRCTPMGLLLALTSDGRVPVGVLRLLRGEAIVDVQHALKLRDVVGLMLDPLLMAPLLCRHV